MYILMILCTKFDLLVFSGYQGDVNSHIMYIVRVAPRHQEFGILVVSEIRGDVNSYTTYIIRVVSHQWGNFSGFRGTGSRKFSYYVHCKNCLASLRKIWNLSAFRWPGSCKFSYYVHCKSCLAAGRKIWNFGGFRELGRCKFLYHVHCKNLSHQRGKFEILLVSGGHGDVNSHTMYIVRVVKRKRVKFEILVVSVGLGDVYYYTV